jgi:hypothetical protein
MIGEIREIREIRGFFIRMPNAFWQQLCKITTAKLNLHQFFSPIY